MQDQVSVGDDPQGNLFLMLLIAQAMLGKRIQLYHGTNNNAVQLPESSQQPVQIQTIQVQTESQQVTFSAQGRVQTADGRTIDFEAHLSLSRQFAQIVTDEGSANGTDPLILNFDGRGVRLETNRIQFDLNADGQQDSIPVVASGSGILFGDLNGDGIANDGAELFGPQSGDGFADLAQQDLDGNGWIDKADPVYGQLRVWTKDGSYSLANVGVGAISTGSVATPFDLRTAGSGLLGQIRATGIYLKENGLAGTLSHVDLTL